MSDTEPARHTKTIATMGLRASAVAKHREEHPDNGAPELSAETQTAMQEAAAKIRALLRR